MNYWLFVVLFGDAEYSDNVVAAVADGRQLQQLPPLVDERLMKRMRPHGDDDMQFEPLHKLQLQHLLAHIAVQVELLVLNLESQTCMHTFFHVLFALYSCHNNTSMPD